MDKLSLASFVYFLVCGSLVVCDRSGDCDSVQLQAAEKLRFKLHNFMQTNIAVYQPTTEAVSSVCLDYAEWDSAMKPLYENCQHYTLVPGFNHENYTRTAAVYKFICDAPDKYQLHRPCLGADDVQAQLQACYNTFWTKYQKEVTSRNPPTMSVIHDRGCDFLDTAIKCVRNASSVADQCVEADADYYEDYFRAYIKPWMNVWNCQFDRSWGWIITTGILVALLAVIALLWVGLFLCCRYCCNCVGGGRSRRDSDDELHPMERY